MMQPAIAICFGWFFSVVFHRDFEQKLVVISFLCIMFIVKEQQCTNFCYFTTLILDVSLYLDIYVY